MGTTERSRPSSAKIAPVSGQTEESKPPSQTDQDENKTNIKETIESILVAFILAFMFRAFVVEAFVIPTGSMAPTLLGAHMRFRCPDCGYEFDVNYTSPKDKGTDDPVIDSKGVPPTDIYCPNCGYQVTPLAERSDQTPYPVQYGDRILVLKYIYLLHPPQRWDVVVFKSPDNPATYNYQQNYIKRLVGKPNEKVMVLDGDVYVSTREDPRWQIQTKPWNVQEAMWRIVYDNDFHPQGLLRQGLPEWQQPWQASDGQGWDTKPSLGDGRTFHFNNEQGAGALKFNPNANSTSHTLTDYLVYDASPSLMRRPSASGSPDDENANPVSDMKLAVYYHRTAGDGPLRLKLSRSESVNHLFTAKIDHDSVTLLHQIDSQDPVQIGKTVLLSQLGVRPGDPMFIEFANVDYQVTLRINGNTAIQSTPADYAPNVAWLIGQWHSHRLGQQGQAFIEAEKQTCTLDHIGLWRDVYYTNRKSNSPSADPLTWGSPDHPMDLNDQEYFVMGDNSAISEDGRYWSVPIDLPHEGLFKDKTDSGRVPEQFMLGQAVFVYWPAGFRLFGGDYSIIPNFGDMRWIH